MNEMRTNAKVSARKMQLILSQLLNEKEKAPRYLMLCFVLFAVFVQINFPTRAALQNSVDYRFS